jgi:DNA modification methylase
METRKISELKLWEDNPRSIAKKAFESLKRKIRRWGQFKPVLITPDGIVIGGNMRLRAYKEMGIEDIWVSVVDPKTEAEKIEIALTDNEMSGRWDEDKLAELVMKYQTEINMDDYHLDLASPISLARLIDEYGPTIEDEPPAVVEGEAVSKPGEIYHLGNHFVMCGDATKTEDYQKLLGGKKAKMVFTDPPYNVDYSGGMHADGSQSVRKKIQNDKMTAEQFYKFLYDVMSNLVIVTRGAFYVCMSSSELHNLWKAFTDAGGHWQTYVIWAKDNFTLSRSDYQHQFEPVMYGLSAEEAKKAEEGSLDGDSLPIMYGWTEHYWYGGRKQGDVWHIARPKKSPDHPTMKPIALCAKAIRNSSNIGDIVLDVFGGSGSTLIACEQTNRICYGMEIDPRYCDTIRIRYWKFVNNNDETGWEQNTPIISSIQV